MTDLRYDVCRACSEPDQLSDLPECAGASQLLKPIGSVCPQLPFIVRLNECPCDEFGVKSKEPRSEPRSVRFSVGKPETVYGMCASARTSRSRETESSEMPTAWSPTGSMSSSVRRSRVLRSS